MPRTGCGGGWGARTRKSVLLVHIASAGAWLGIDVVMAVLVFTALFTDDDRTKALSFQVLELVAVSLGVGDLIFPPIVSQNALLASMVLAVFKAWGRIRAADG